MRYNFLNPAVTQAPTTPVAAVGARNPVNPVNPVSRPTSDVPVLSFNAEKNGVEIKFPGKPDADTLSKLKAAGWRWSFRSSCWYHKHTPENLAWAQALIGGGQPGGASVPASQSPPTNIIPLPTLSPSASSPAPVAPPMPAWRARLLRRPLSI